MILRLSALVPFVASLLLAQTAPVKPPNASGQCRDGTYSTATTKSGACRGHNGVKEWYAPAPVPEPPPAAPATAAAPGAPPATAPAPLKRGPKANLANIPQAPGGGPGLVWVNSTSNVYHCPTSDFYGKTKVGSYMSEADAKAKGAHPNHGKTCTK